MTLEEKGAAFDAIAKALTNQWWDGTWSWWCPVPAGGPRRPSREEAVADLVAWARSAKRRPLRVIGAENETPGLGKREGSDRIGSQLPG